MILSQMAGKENFDHDESRSSFAIHDCSCLETDLLRPKNENVLLGGDSERDLDLDLDRDDRVERDFTKPRWDDFLLLLLLLLP